MKRLLLLAGLLPACSPRLYAPQPEVPATYLHAEAPAPTAAPATPADGATAEIAPDWWTLFGDTTLNRLVVRALNSNRDLAAAASRIEEARANLKVARAQFLPQVSLGVEAEATYSAATKIVQSYTVAPALQWELSLFGALRNADLTARARLAAEEWAYRGVRLSLVAEVATAYFTLLEYQRDLALARRTCELRRESAALVDSMHRYGMSDGVALAQARSLVYTAAADIPRYARAVEQTWLSLGTLLGEAPRRFDLPGEGEQLLSDRYPAEVPTGLPSELLERRPDIRQARYTWMQAAGQAGSARSARFPSIPLTAKGGIASASIKDLTAANPWSWEALASLTQPLFAFGKLKRAEQAAVEAYNQAARNYEQTVLEAFSEVEQALVAVTTAREQTARSRQLVAANDTIAALTRQLYRSGLSDYLDVIDAERELYSSQMQLVNLTAQQYINYITLIKALGGGWPAPPDDESP